MDTIIGFATGLIEPLYGITSGLDLGMLWIVSLVPAGLFAVIAWFGLCRNQADKLLRFLVSAAMAMIGMSFGMFTLVLMMFMNVTDSRWGNPAPEPVSVDGLSMPDMSGVPAVGKALDDFGNSIESGVNGTLDSVVGAFNQTLETGGLVAAAFETAGSALPYLGIILVALVMAVTFGVMAIFRSMRLHSKALRSELEDLREEIFGEGEESLVKQHEKTLEAMAAQHTKELEDLNDAFTKKLEQAVSDMANPALAAARRKRDKQVAAYESQKEIFHRPGGKYAKLNLSELPFSEHKDYVANPNAYHEHQEDARRHRDGLVDDRLEAARRNQAQPDWVSRDPDRLSANPLMDELQGLGRQ